MPAYRYFLPSSFSIGEMISLKNEEFHHLKNVFRHHCGEVVELINGKGDLAQGKIEAFHKNHADLKILSSHHFPPLTPSITIAQAMIRFSSLELILQKGTELGMNEIWLFPGEKSNEKKPFSKEKSERIERILIASLKQCGGLHLPKVTFFPSLNSLKWNQQAFFGHFEDSCPFKSVLKEVAPTLFFVGPESGWSSKEIAFLRTKEAQPVSLNPYILRAETAPLCALSILRCFFQ